MTKVTTVGSTLAGVLRRSTVRRVGRLEDEIRRELYRAALSRPAALEAMSTGETVHGDLSALIRDVMLPLLMAQGDAIVRLASEVDALREQLGDPDAQQV